MDGFPRTFSRLLQTLYPDKEKLKRPSDPAYWGFMAIIFAFAIGAVIPLLPWFMGSGNAAIVASVVLGLVASAIVGVLLARFTERSAVRTALRQVSWAAGACAVTFGIGSLLGTTVS